MNYTYKLTAGFVADEEGKLHKIYGIVCLSGTKFIKKIKDISCDKAKVIHFIELCNKLELNPIHLNDAVEDLVE